MRVSCLFILVTHASMVDAQSPTLAESVAAQPAWARPIDHQHHSTFPSVPDPAALFAQADVHRGTLDSGLLLCRLHVRYGHPWDARGIFGGFIEPDITLYVGIGAGPRVTVRAPEDQRDVFWSVPSVSLQTGTQVRITAYDRDLAADDSIGAAYGRYDGELPFRLGTSTGVEVECRSIDHSQALARARPHLNLATIENQQLLHSLHPQPTDVSFALPEERVAQSREALLRAASYLGWAVPEIQLRLTELEQLETRWTEEARAVLHALELDLPPLAASASEIDIDASAIWNLERAGYDPGGLDQLFSETLPRTTELFGHSIEWVSGRAVYGVEEARLQQARAARTSNRTFDGTSHLAAVEGYPMWGWRPCRHGQNRISTSMAGVSVAQLSSRRERRGCGGNRTDPKNTQRGNTRLAGP